MRLKRIANMLAALERSPDDRQQADLVQDFGRALLDEPDPAAQLVDMLAGMGKAGAREDAACKLLGAALDEARMARENGQSRGAALIGAAEARLGRTARADALSIEGRLLLSRCWVRAGLRPPEELASGQESAAAPHPLAETDEPPDMGAVFDKLFRDVIGAGEGSASTVHSVFAEMLPTIPPDARHALVRTAVARPDEVCAELGCAWLLDGDDGVRMAAADGLLDRLDAGWLSAQVLSRLTIMRSWLSDEALKARLDDLLRAAMRSGIALPGGTRQPDIHRVVASMVDGSGAQSMAAATRTGASSRSVAVVLLKEGFGVKDAYVIPCASATEQRNFMATIAVEIEACDVSRDYLVQALGLALSEGIGAEAAPGPGLVDVAHACGLTELRPGASTTGDILALADPDGRIAGLSAQARGRLITASRFWEERHAMLSSWFEDSDETVAALETATSPAALKRAMWAILDARRTHWARVIARNALLLTAAGEDGAEEFVAVAAAMTEGRDLRKTPVMQFVHEQSLEVWFDRTSGPGDPFGWQDTGFDGAPTPAPALISPDDMPAEKRGEMARFLDPAGLTEPWLEGYLAGVCAAPVVVPPSDWLGPVLNLVAEGFASPHKFQRFVGLVMVRYNATLPRPGAPDDASPIPQEPSLLPFWADGFLTAWETNKGCWPAKVLGRQGKAIRKLLEDATDGQIDRTGFATTLPAWLRKLSAERRR